ncbi:MAG: flagellar hook-length control protein FliK [Planctomycetota bacterium]|nr:MAG: flagellar hook-length control protein FliK [Planctomycetota bacterium]
MSVDVLAAANTPAPQSERSQIAPRRGNSHHDHQRQSSDESERTVRTRRRLSATAPSQESSRSEPARKTTTRESFRQHLNDDGKDSGSAHVLPHVRQALDSKQASLETTEAEHPLLALSLELAEDFILNAELDVDAVLLPPAIEQLLAEDDGEAELAQLLAELFPQLAPQLEAQGLLPSEPGEEAKDHLLRDDDGDIIGVMIGDQLYPVQLQVENSEGAVAQAAQLSSTAPAAALAEPTTAKPSTALPQGTNPAPPGDHAKPVAKAPLVAAAPSTGEAMPQVVLPVSETPSLEGQQGQATWLSNSNGTIDISRMASTSSAEPPAPQSSSEAERAVEQQIKRALIQQMANGDRSMTLRLTPPNLGTVRIEIIEQRGMLTVRFSAEDDRVRQALERQLPQLRQDLRASDAPVSSVRMDDHSSGWQHDQQQRQGQAHARQGSNSPGRFSLDDEEIDSDADGNDSQAAQSRSALGGTISDTAVDARA